MGGMEAKSPYRPRWQTPLAIALLLVSAIVCVVSMAVCMVGMMHNPTPEPYVSDLVLGLAEAGFVVANIGMPGAIILYFWAFNRPGLPNSYSPRFGRVHIQIHDRMMGHGWSHAEVDPVDETRSGLRFHVILFSSPRDPYPRSRAAAALEGALILYRLFNTACEQLQ